MKKTFVNFTNHAVVCWEEKEKEAAQSYGEIREVPFPNIDPASSEEEIKRLGDVCYEKIMAENPAAVLCQGEFTLAVYVIQRLKKDGVPVLAACSKRVVTMTGDEKRSVFHFVKFREYI